MKKAPASAKIVKRATSKFNTVCCKMERKPYDMNDVVKAEYSTLDECIVVKNIYVDDYQWKKVTSDFFEDWAMWDKIGGSLEINGTYLTMVCKLINEDTGECVYVNTEGYDYARYVGLELK